MILLQRKWVLITFDPWSWNDLYHAIVTGWLVFVCICEILAPGWAATMGLRPHVNWWHPETWLTTWWKGQL